MSPLLYSENPSYLSEAMLDCNFVVDDLFCFFFFLTNTEVERKLLGWNYLRGWGRKKKWWEEENKN
jgi:hypothetical protein